MRQTLEHARRLAVQQRMMGRPLTTEQSDLIACWCDEIGPEMFFMDGELFADQYV